MLSVLVIGYVWPEPNSSAAGSHMLSLLRLYKDQGWQVTFASPAQTTEHMIDLADEGIDSVAIELNSSSFDSYIQQLQPDIVMFDRFMMEEQFGWRVEKNCPNALRILDTEDLQCLRNARHQAVKQNREMELSDLYSDLAKREIASIYRSDLSLIISSYEMQLLQQQFHMPAEQIHYLPFMLDLAQLPTKGSAEPSSYSQRQHLLMIGNFRHAPNWDSVLHMQALWPKLREQLKKNGQPNVELHIYGSYPPPKATALNNPKSGFLIKGWAEDAYQVMTQARLCLAPLRFGAGIKGKLLDAMVCGTPSITTPIGAEGMLPTLQNKTVEEKVVEDSALKNTVFEDIAFENTALEDQAAWPGIIACDDQAFIDATVELYCQPDHWQQKQQQAPALLAELYDGAKTGPELIQRILALKENLTQHRLENFTGAMLNHHSMKSTQYMSQWIEAKNKLPAD